MKQNKKVNGKYLGVFEMECVCVCVERERERERESQSKTTFSQGIEKIFYNHEFRTNIESKFYSYDECTMEREQFFYNKGWKISETHDPQCLCHTPLYI